MDEEEQRFPKDRTAIKLQLKGKVMSLKNSLEIEVHKGKSLQGRKIHET